AKLLPSSPLVKTIGYSRAANWNSVWLMGMALPRRANSGTSPGASRRTFWVFRNGTISRYRTAALSALRHHKSVGGTALAVKSAASHGVVAKLGERRVRN